MSVADSVPGVSGGTIAFVLGFYESFITALADITSKDGKKRKQAFIYLIKLGVGWAVGMVLCMLILSKLFESHVYILCSAFLGFTIAAIPFVIMAELDTIKGKYYNLIFTVLGVALVVGLSLLRGLGDGGNGSVSFIEGLSFLQYFYVFIVGAFAICAMVLPGISGSTILLICGVYVPVVNGVSECLHFNLSFHLLAGLAVFALGILTGILTSVKGIRFCLERFRSQTVYFIVGLMLGSLFAIVKGPETLEVPKAALNIIKLGGENGLNLIAFIIGIALIVGLELTKKAFESRGRK